MKVETTTILASVAESNVLHLWKSKYFLKHKTFWKCVEIHLLSLLFHWKENKKTIRIFFLDDGPWKVIQLCFYIFSYSMFLISLLCLQNWTRKKPFAYCGRLYVMCADYSIQLFIVVNSINSLVEAMFHGLIGTQQFRFPFQDRWTLGNIFSMNFILSSLQVAFGMGLRCIGQRQEDLTYIK